MQRPPCSERGGRWRRVGSRRIPAGARLALAVLPLATALPGQNAPSRVRPPRPLGPIEARATTTFESISRLFALAGSVLVNDPESRQVILLDSTLTNRRIVLDSVLGRANSYPGTSAATGLHRFRGDSAFWAYSGATEALIIAPDGRIARIAATPQEGGPCLFMDMDNTGFITCDRPIAATQSAQERQRAAAVGRGHDTTVLTRQDSSLVVAIEFTTWRVDTIGRFVKRLGGTLVTYSARGTASSQYVVPVMAVDLWTMFRDGSLAVVRGVDYHVDIVPTAGPAVRGPRVAYPWRPLTDADYAAVLDSLHRRDSLALVAQVARLDSIARATGRALPPGLVAGGGPSRVYADRADWPSYWPAFLPTAFFSADEDGRLWLQEATPPGADSVNVYAVFSRRGELLDRVTTPRGTEIRGFGPGSAVYLFSMDAGRATLMKARFR